MLKLKRFGQSAWHDFPGCIGVKLKIKPLSRKDIFDIRSRSKRKMSVTGNDQIVDDYDESAFVWEMFKGCLEGWESIEMEEGLTLSRDEMLLAIYDNDSLREFIFQKANKSASEEETILEGELKNSESSQGGS